MPLRTFVLLWLLLLVIVGATGQAEATTRFVPPFPTIQSAIDASATAGDTVRVLPGTYVENLVMLNKDVVVLSQGGAESTIIDGGSPTNPDQASVVLFQGVGERGKLSGFTLTHGTGMPGAAGGTWRAGGGIAIIHSHDRGPVIENNVVIDNGAGRGAGILMAGTARVLQNRIASNLAIDHGGGILVEDPNPTTSDDRKLIQENEIFSNSAIDGGGIKVLNSGVSALDFVRNVVACNQAPQGAGMSAGGNSLENRYEGNTFHENNNWNPGDTGGVIYLYTSGNASIVFQGNILSSNTGRAIECFRGQGSQAPVFGCNDLYNNSLNPPVDSECAFVFGQNGNLNVNPLFVSAPGCPPGEPDHYVCLQEGSPMLPENSPSGCGLIGARGLCPLIGIADPESAAPARMMASAHPNPFAERTTVAIELPTAAPVVITIVDVRGRLVASVTPGVIGPGRHEVPWDGLDMNGQRVPSGITSPGCGPQKWNWRADWS
jgi:hypothetical protein